MLIGALLVLALLWGFGVFDERGTSTTVPTLPVITDNPPVEDPPTGPETYTVAHGDILQDGDCHMRVFGPGEAVNITSSGEWKIATITASSNAELSAEIEALRDTVSRWSRTGECPNG
jgi:hypothetical protein